jgi:hypothetical protein
MNTESARALIGLTCDLIDDDTRRQRLRHAVPDMPLDDAERIIAAVRSVDSEKSHRAFQVALMKIVTGRELRKHGFAKGIAE